MVSCGTRADGGVSSPAPATSRQQQADDDAVVLAVLALIALLSRRIQQATPAELLVVIHMTLAEQVGPVADALSAVVADSMGAAPVPGAQIAADLQAAMLPYLHDPVRAYQAAPPSECTRGVGGKGSAGCRD